MYICTMYNVHCTMYMDIMLLPVTVRVVVVTIVVCNSHRSERVMQLVDLKTDKGLKISYK